MAALYELNQVDAVLGGQLVLRAINGTISEGSFVGVIGPNGAGKTTLIRLLAGLLRPAGGRLLLRGEPLQKVRRRDLARRLAAVPCSIDLPVAFTVEECVAMGRTPYLSSWGFVSATDWRAIRQALETMDLLELAARPFHALSGGERQRTLVAMALAQEPEILLLDEPTAHLDLHHAWDLMERVQRLHTERPLTIVMSSHDLNLAGTCCSELILLDRGEVRCWAAPCEVLAPEVLSEVYGYALDVLPVGAHGRWVVPRWVAEKRQA